MARILLGGLVAGIVVFIWGAVSHLALPIGMMGVHSIPNEEAVMATLRASITARGFYFFPGMDNSKSATKSEMDAHAAKVRQGPAGILVIQPNGAETMSPGKLGTEFATNVLAAVLAAGLVAQVRLGYAGRVLFVTMLGVFAFVTINIPYGNWYGFPVDFLSAEAIDQVVGWLLAGLVLGAIIRPASAAVGTRIQDVA